MGSERRSLTPWAIRDRLERLVSAKKEVRLHWETAFVLLEALRAYIANPKRDKIAAIICMRQHVARAPCEPLCRRCLETAYELKQLFRGEINPFGDEEEPRPRRRGNDNVWAICKACRSPQLLPKHVVEKIKCPRCGSEDYNLTVNDPTEPKRNVATTQEVAPPPRLEAPAVDLEEARKNGTFP
ncbi:hypothetical protein OSH11_13875 [Kaistia dalseonensis]|uniref:Ribosomal protein L37E n=1 Tax=Kaistia dalseonensis TaxID=410840 RepID=A0ABU0H7W1_9HYPH|nr:hypothetical protein [Kaistia dalseonensis]MCX5495798.1 hypothetical protein [Kaistia dalseonensis]MDQ0438399.1 ribosomal protein L37E [Kaistia dalseonensis]